MPTGEKCRKNRAVPPLGPTSEVGSLSETTSQGQRPGQGQGPGPSFRKGDLRKGSGAWLVDLLFGKPAPRQCLQARRQRKQETEIPLRATRRWFEISLSAAFCVLAILCFLEFRGYPPGSMNGLPMVIGPIILGLAGAISGLLARSPVMAALNLFAAFFLVPAYMILWEGYFF